MKPNTHLPDKRNQKERLRDTIYEAVNLGAAEYPGNPRMQYLFALGFLTELLSYSAQNQWEVQEHLKRYIKRKQQEHQ